MKYTRISGRLIAASLAVVTLTCRPAVAQLADIPQGDLAVRLIPIATGLSAPLYGIHPPGDSNRMFVLEQNGLVRVVENGSLLTTPALNLQSRVSPPLTVTSATDERGLLGIAFHPDFFNQGTPGYRTLYTYTSEATTNNPVTFPLPNEPSQAVSVLNYVNVVSEYKMTTPTSNVIDPASRRVVFTIGKDQPNHNGGTISFGPDKYLYLATGDGGGANDRGRAHLEPTGNAQNLSVALGKMLRIDPIDPSLTPASPDDISANTQYRIPDANPFSGAGQLREIYAYGLRNPYRYAFDDLGAGHTNDLILADVGQNNVEEIDRITIGGNYGWAIKEGTFPFNRVTGGIGANSPGSPAGLIDPISGTVGTLEYDHGDGISITGGFVYRGAAIPQLFGKYVFGDLAIRGTPSRVDGRLFYADLGTGEIKEFRIPQFVSDQIPGGLTVHGFGRDGSGELYAMVTNTAPNGTGGIIYKFAAVPEPATGVLLVVMCVAGASKIRRRKRES